jgi:transposase
MRFAGIDISGERHAVAVVSEGGAVLVKSTFFGEEAAGYQQVRDLLDDPRDCLVAMEATGGTIDATCSRFWWDTAFRWHG